MQQGPQEGTPALIFSVYAMPSWVFCPLQTEKDMVTAPCSLLRASVIINDVNEQPPSGVHTNDKLTSTMQSLLATEVICRIQLCSILIE